MRFDVYIRITADECFRADHRPLLFCVYGAVDLPLTFFERPTYRYSCAFRCIRVHRAPHEQWFGEPLSHCISNVGDRPRSVAQRARIAMDMNYMKGVQRLLAAVLPTPHWESVAAAQHAILLSRFQSARFRSDEQADMVEFIGTMDFRMEEKNTLIGAVVANCAPPAVAAPTGNSARKPQDFTLCRDFFVEAWWNSMRRPDILPCSKKDLLMTTMWNMLKCELPDEKTFRDMTIILLLCQGSSPLTMTSEECTLTNKTLKADFKQFARNKPKSASLWPSLPASPARLAVEDPARYKAMYGDEHPIKCPLDALAMDQLRAMVDCRPGKKNAGAAQFASLVQGLQAQRGAVSLRSSAMPLLDAVLPELRPTSASQVGLHKALMDAPSTVSSLGGVVAAGSREVAPQSSVVEPTGALPKTELALAPQSSVIEPISALPKTELALAHHGGVGNDATPAARPPPECHVTEAMAKGISEPSRKRDVGGALDMVLKAMDERDCKRKGAAKKVASPKKVATPKKKALKPTYSVERSRSQVMFRTGAKGVGSTFRIPYGKGEKCATEEQAIKVAMRMVKDAGF